MSGKIKALKGQAGVRCAGRRRSRCTLKNLEAMTKAAIRKVVRAIKAELRDIDRRSAVEQMAVYIDIGRRLKEVAENERKYGSDAMREIAELVPELKSEGHAYEIRDLAAVGTGGKEYIFEHTALPMSSGMYLSLGHWLWLMRHMSWMNPSEPGVWLCSELAWLRKESPSAEILEHVDAVWEKRHSRELQVAQETVRKAVGLLESV